MAQVTSRAKLNQRITDYLDYLESEWRAVSEVAREWDEWSDHEQMDFVLEWPIREDRLSQLRNWAEQDLLSQEQRQRYVALLQLVAKHRPTVEKLLAD